MGAIVKINWKRAERVFDLLIEALDNRRFPYDTAETLTVDSNLPQNFAELTPKEQARFFLVTCYYMQGIFRSDGALRGLSKVFESNPEIFLDSFADLTENERAQIQPKIESLLRQKEYNSRPEKISQYWVDNFVKLDTYWDGDPRNLFKGIQNFDELFARIAGGKNGKKRESTGFYGFREKMVSMLAYLFMRHQLMPYFPLPVPVDFHVLRVLTACRLLEVKGAGPDYNLYSASYLAAARKLTFEYCQKKKISYLKLGDCLWLISRLVCRYHPDNCSTRGKYQAHQTEIKPITYQWTRSRIRKFISTCEQCPIRKYCKLAVPSGHYYLRAKILVRKRTEPAKSLLTKFKL